MKRKHTIRFFSILTALGIAAIFGLQANPETADNPGGFSMIEMTKLTKEGLSTAEEYNGPQTTQALMEAFDEIYNSNHLKTLVIIYRKTDGGTVSASVLTTSEENLSHKIDSVDEKRHVSQFTNEEIDARYPRAAWLQILLDKGITIEHLGEYASYLSKRHTLAFLEDNPNLRNTGILGIPPTNEWGTYKTAYIDKLVNDHAQIRKASKQIQQSKAQIESAKAQVERAKKQAERVKNKFNSQQLENIRKQIERLRETIERLQKSIPPQSPNQNMKKKPPTIQI